MEMHDQWFLDTQGCTFLLIFGIPYFAIRLRFVNIDQIMSAGLSFEELSRLYLIQLTKGCKTEGCCNMDCAKNVTCMNLSVYSPLDASSKEYARRAVEMCKEGTSLSCMTVNRIFNYPINEMEKILPSSILEDMQCCKKLRKYVFKTTFKV